MAISKIENASLASGVPQRSQLPAGTVLQVVSQQYTGTYISTTSTSFVASGITASITPTSSTSKILVLAAFNVQSPTAGSDGTITTVYRNGSTNLFAGGSSGGGHITYFNAASYIHATTTLSALDSPATTSSTSYQVYFSSLGGATAYITKNWGTATITLMEIAA